MLFIFFVVLIPIAVWLILHFVSRREADDEALPKVPMEVCALCQNEFPMEQLLEKEVGGYGRVYCFCGQCIENLNREYQETRAHSTPTERTETK